MKKALAVIMAAAMTVSLAGCGGSSSTTATTAAAQAVERVGMPESQIILSQAVTYMACAPKSNSAVPYPSLRKSIVQLSL